MRRKHYVPLCHQALAILEELKDFTYDVNGDHGFILTGCCDAMKPMSENTINEALSLIVFCIFKHMVFFVKYF